MKILILGASGMLGNAMLKVFLEKSDLIVYGTVRGDSSSKNNNFRSESSRILTNVDVLADNDLLRVMAEVKPQVVVNCIGLVKQLAHVNDPLIALPINSLLPHKLALICTAVGSRLVHVSTDCVFSGKKGMYLETDEPDATDLYGKSKQLGEVTQKKNVITIRTSIIGHEVSGCRSLIDWFLSQSGSVNGYNNAIFSGLPTYELARVIRDFIIPRPELFGLYHVSADPIDKYSLLKLVKDVYEKDIQILQDSSYVVDRSLVSTKFRNKVGYSPDNWLQLIKLMNEYFKKEVS